MPLKMNAAAEVLSVKHWPPRGVYTRWRPRKRFCSGIVCIPPTSERKLSARRFAVCSILDIVRLFFGIFAHVHSAVPPRKAIRTNQFQNGTLTKNVLSFSARQLQRRVDLRASLPVRILTPGHQKDGWVARYFLLSLAFNLSCENRATGVQSRLTQLWFR
jgi:hypothetical protein